MKRASSLKRRTPLRSSSSLALVTRLAAKRSRPRRSSRVLDPAYLAAVHRLPCFASLTVPGHRCEGRIEADHQGSRPAGRKADDDSCVPLCTLAHRQRTDWSGPFRSWDKARMREWLASGIAWTWAQIRKATINDRKG